MNVKLTFLLHNPFLDSGEFYSFIESKGYKKIQTESDRWRQTDSHNGNKKSERCTHDSITNNQSWLGFALRTGFMQI